MEIPMAATTRPIMNGARLEPGEGFRWSMMARVIPTRAAVPTTWSTNGSTQLPWKYWAGNVAKIEKVPTEFCWAVWVASSRAVIDEWYSAYTTAAPRNAPSTWANQYGATLRRTANERVTAGLRCAPLTPPAT